MARYALSPGVGCRSTIALDGPWSECPPSVPPVTTIRQDIPHSCLRAFKETRVLPGETPSGALLKAARVPLSSGRLANLVYEPAGGNPNGTSTGNHWHVVF